MASETRLIYVAGHGHSGSTLLDLLLSGHSQVTSTGEADFLSECGSSPNPIQKCGCGQTVDQCSFWMGVRDELAVQNGESTSCPPRERWKTFSTKLTQAASLWQNRFHLLKFSLIASNRPTFHLLARLSPYLRRFLTAARRNWQLFDTVSRLQGTPFIVDASKKPERLRLLSLVRPDSVWMIHLIRDGRGVAASEKAREDWPVAISTLSWRRRFRDVQLLARSLPAERRRFLRYEDLCADPEGQLRNLCAFLNLDYEPSMLAMSHDGHGLGGSRVRFDPARRSSIRLDERWRQVLNPSDLRTFKRVGGRLNDRLGYGTSLGRCA